MKTKINPKLRKLLSKHFANQVFGRVGVPISATREDIAGYWSKCPKQLQTTSLCFFSKELIDLVNVTNSKLLCAEFIVKSPAADQDATNDANTANDDWSLLNTFEMLWNVDQAAK